MFYKELDLLEIEGIQFDIYKDEETIDISTDFHGFLSLYKYDGLDLDHLFDKITKCESIVEFVSIVKEHEEYRYALELHENKTSKNHFITHTQTRSEYYFGKYLFVIDIENN